MTKRTSADRCVNPTCGGYASAWRSADDYCRSCDWRKRVTTPDLRTTATEALRVLDIAASGNTDDDRVAELAHRASEALRAALRTTDDGPRHICARHGIIFSHTEGDGICYGAN